MSLKSVDFPVPFEPTIPQIHPSEMVKESVHRQKESP